MTHNLRQAKRLSDYVIFLYLGDLIEHGEADNFFNKPKYAKTKAYIEGRFIEDFKIDRDISLRNQKNLAESLKSVLKELKEGQVLRVLLEDEAAVKVISSEAEYEGHVVLEATRIELQSWQIIVRKQNVNYTI